MTKLPEAGGAERREQEFVGSDARVQVAAVHGQVEVAVVAVGARQVVALLLEALGVQVVAARVVRVVGGGEFELGGCDALQGLEVGVEGAICGGAEEDRLFIWHVFFSIRPFF
jgi:hypothetical protein